MEVASVSSSHSSSFRNLSFASGENSKTFFIQKSAISRPPSRRDVIGNGKSFKAARASTMSSRSNSSLVFFAAFFRPRLDFFPMVLLFWRMELQQDKKYNAEDRLCCSNAAAALLNLMFKAAFSRYLYIILRYDSNYVTIGQDQFWRSVLPSTQRHDYS